MGWFNANASLFHSRQHARQRQIDPLIDFAQARRSVDFRIQPLSQSNRQVGMLFRGRAKFAIDIPFCKDFGRAPGWVSAQQKSVQHHVVPEALGFDSIFGERERQALHVVRYLGAIRVFEERF